MIRVGVIGTSGWTERMYMTALQDHPYGKVVAVCARDPERTHAFAERWELPHVFTDWEAMLDSGTIDAVIISTPNHLHHPITMKAAANGIHVLCEKPLAMSDGEAQEMADAIDAAGLVGMTGFTYWYFPHYRYITQLVNEGFVGTPYHLNLRYFSGYGMDGSPLWRFDSRLAGPGALADIGSHALSLARAFLGDVVAVSAMLDTKITREGIPADRRAIDHASMMLRFANGATGLLDISMASYQPKKGGQKQALELSGSEGTLYYGNDFFSDFNLSGVKLGEDEVYELRVPDDLWPPSVSRETPQAMFADLFTKTNAMAREFVSAIAEKRPPSGPDLREGAAVQKLQDAAFQSAASNAAWVEIK